MIPFFSRHRVAVALTAIVLMFCVTVGVILFLLAPPPPVPRTNPHMIVVPAVVGTVYDSDQFVKEYPSIKLIVEYKFDDTIPANQVISQIPPAGRPMSAGDSMNITVSKGQQRVQVPEVRENEGIDDYTARAEAVGLVVKTVVVPDDRPMNTVISTSPAYPEEVDSGSIVLVMICQSVCPGLGEQTSPDLSRMTLEAARSQILGLGLAVGGITYQRDKYPAGTVLSQNPAAGTSIMPGNPVNLVVSSGPAG